MKLSTLISILQGTLKTNGDMHIVGMVNGEIFTDFEINCPDDESPAYLELYKED